MKKLFVAISVIAMLLVVFSITAMAQGTQKQINWSGPYIGLNTGYGSGEWDIFSYGDDGDITGSTSFNPENEQGILGGIETGYNWMSKDYLVFGISGDFSLADINGSKTFSYDHYDGSSYSVSDKITLYSFDTLRGRLGYASNRFLVFGTVGVARAQAEIETTEGYSIGRNATGWVWGCCVEYAITNRWSEKIEYIRLQMKDVDYENAIHPFNIIRVGINYNF